MPLPSSGTISTDDLNEELGNDAGTAIDLETAADSFGVTYLTDGSDPIEFDEFYGLSFGSGYAENITSISPSSIVSSSADGEEHTITYTSDGVFFINDDGLDWVTASATSGSSGSNQTFTLTTNQQSLNATSRTGTITLESPLLSSYITYSVHQDDNDATLQISPQPISTNVIAYGYQGGEDEYYKVETSPEEVVTWTATLSNTTDFSHREGSSGAFTTNAIDGTGDAFIYVKGNANSSTSSLLTTTITVDPTNIDDPTVTTTGTVNKYPYIELSGNEISEMGSGNYVISSGFAYDDNTVQEGYTINVTSNYGMLSVGGASLSGTNANKFGISQSTFSFVVYPNSINTSGASYTATVTVTVNSDPNFSINFTISQASANPPVLSGSPTSMTWAYNEILSSDAQTFTLGVTNNGNDISAVNINYNPGIQDGRFKLVDYGTGDGGLTVSNQYGDVWNANVTNPSSSTFKVNVLPTAQNTGSADITGALSVSVSYGDPTTTITSSSIVDLTHQYQQLSAFTYADAGVSGFAVNRNTGLVTAPTNTAGTISSLSYSTGYSSGYYPVVTTSATRTVDVTVTVPSTGYSNSGGSVSGQESTTQLAALETISLSTSQGSPIGATGASFSVSVDVVDAWNTEWEASISYVSIGSVGDWVSIDGTSTGTGDGTVTQITVDSNYTNGSYYQSQRQFTVQVQKPGGAVISTLNFSQNSSAPPETAPVTTITSPSGASPTLTFAYDDTNTSTEYQTITFGRSAGSNETVATARIFGDANGGDRFKLISTNAQTTVTEPSTDMWVANFNNEPASSYTVGVIPQGTNATSANFTGTVECKLSNNTGHDTETVSLIQEFQELWSVTPTSLSFTNSAQIKTVTLSSSYAWTAGITGTGMSVTPTSGNAGTSTLSVSSTANSGVPITGTLTISATGQSDLTVSLSQAGGDANLDVSWNNGLTYNSGGQTTTTTLTNNSSTYREYEIYARQDYSGTVTWELSQSSTHAVWVTSSGTSTSDQTANVGTSAKKQTLRVLANNSQYDETFIVNVTSLVSLDIYQNTYTHEGDGSGDDGDGGDPGIPQD